MISQLAVWYENLEGWSQVVEPKIKKIEEKIPHLAKLLREVAKQTYWFVLPGTLIKLSAETQALPITNYLQDAINSNGQVFIAGQLKRTVEERGNLLFHELVMSTLFRHPYYGRFDRIQQLHKDTAKLEVDLSQFIDRFDDRQLVERIQNITPIFKKALTMDEVFDRSLTEALDEADRELLGKLMQNKALKGITGTAALTAKGQLSPEELARVPEIKRMISLVREYEVLTAFSDLKPQFKFEPGPQPPPLSQEEQLRQPEESKLKAAREEQINAMASDWIKSSFVEGNLIPVCEDVTKLDLSTSSPSGFSSRSDYADVVKKAWLIRDRIASTIRQMTILSIKSEEDSIQSCKLFNPNCDVNKLISQRNKLDELQKMAAKVASEKLNFLDGFSFLLWDYESDTRRMSFRRILSSDEVGEDKRKSVGSVINDIAKYSGQEIKYGMDPAYLFSIDRTQSNIEKVAEIRTDKNYMAKYNYLVLHFTAVACRRFVK